MFPVIKAGKAAENRLEELQQRKSDLSVEVAHTSHEIEGAGKEI